MDYGEDIVLDSYNIEETLSDDDIPAMPAPIDTDARMNEYRMAANDAVAKGGDVNKGTEHAVSRARNGEDLDKVKMRKKRNPMKKVDAELLLSKNGLSRLRHEGTKLRFQGKGNEAKDLCKFMNFYQMWAHELYPRLQFRDFVRMAEKTCHQRRCRVHLTQWQNEATGGTADTTIAEHGLSGMTLEERDNGATLEVAVTDRNETTQPPTEPSPRPLPPPLHDSTSSRPRQDHQVVHPTSSLSLNSATGEKTDESLLERIRTNRAIALAKLAKRQQQPQEKAKTSQCGVPTNDAPSLPSSSLQVVGPFEFGEEPVDDVDPAEEYLNDFDF